MSTTTRDITDTFGEVSTSTNTSNRTMCEKDKTSKVSGGFQCALCDKVFQTQLRGRTSHMNHCRKKQQACVQPQASETRDVSMHNLWGPHKQEDF